MQRLSAKSTQDLAKSAGAVPPRDLKDLWDHWDALQQETSPRQYLRGANLLGLVLLTAGAGLWLWGPVSLKMAGSVSLASGAMILAVKRFRALWQKKSLLR